MSPRVTRSSARLSAGSSSTNIEQSSSVPTPSPPLRSKPNSRKRKASARAPSPVDPPEAETRSRRHTNRAELQSQVTTSSSTTSTSTSKRRKLSNTGNNMSSSGYVYLGKTHHAIEHRTDCVRPQSGPSREASPPQAALSSTKTRFSRRKAVSGTSVLSSISSISL